MEIDLKIVDAIKNNDLNRINFFKQEIAKELRNKGIDIEKIDSLCEEILMEAVNGYTKETPIRFLFYIKKIINSKVSTLKNDFLKEKEIDILKFYLTKHNGYYLNTYYIAKKLKLSEEFIYNTVNKAIKNKEETKKYLPNFENDLKQRRDFFEYNNDSLTNAKIKLILYYTGKIDNKCYTVEELKDIYNWPLEIMKKRLRKSFAVLKRDNNLDKLLEKEPSLKDIIYDKAKEIGIDLIMNNHANKEKISTLGLTDKERDILILLEKNKDKPLTNKKMAELLGYNTTKAYTYAKSLIKAKAKGNEEIIKEVNELHPDFLRKNSILTKKEIKILKLLDEHSKVPLSNKEMAELLEYKNKETYTAVKTALLKKIREDEKVKEEALKICPNLLNKEVLLNSKEIEILKLLNKHKNKPLTDQEMARLLEYKYNYSYITAKYRLLKKIEKNENVKALALKIYPELFDKDQVLTSRETMMLKILKETENRIISDEELAEMIGFRNKDAYNYAKRKLYKKIEESEKIKEEALKIYPDFINYMKSLTIREIEILSILKEHQDNPLSNEEMAKLLGYKNEKTYNSAKSTLKRKIIDNDEIAAKIKEIYPEFLEEIDLTDKERKVLNLLSEHQDNPLSNEEMAKLLGYKNINSYFRFKKNMSKKLSENIELKERLLSKYPFLERKVTLTNNEITILKEYYHINSGQTSYKSTNEIANDLNYSYQTIYSFKEKALKKITSDTTCKEQIIRVYPHFEDDLMIKNNYSSKNSINLTETELSNVKNYQNLINKKDSIKKGLEALNNSIFKDFMEFCSLKEQLILAFSLGFFNKHPFNSKDVADIFNIDEISVINLTHECLSFTRNRLEQKDKTKVKSSSH